MAASQYDVIIVGAGPAGITAAIALAKAHIPVLVIEGAAFPGAENWSGAVYFTENLAQPDVLGPQAVAEAAWERPVTKRGAYIYNGHSMVGLAYRNPDTFRHCYTVLRPTFDHYLAELAKTFGATILTETTVTGLLRDDTGRITGVQTNRGAFHSKVVFLAEGDASHLVTKEGYEKTEPHFLQGICELIELPPDEIERHFNLPKGEGAAFEIILRNGSLHNRQTQLNMGGFIYTNAASVSVGLVLPLDNLAKEFSGDHNLLMEWFKALPEVRRWAGNGRTIAYGAKIIRGGGYRELPQLVDNGLALGGACTGIGLDFPYPNFTGPATAMGRLFAQAVQQARGDFSRERLTELYEKPLRQTHYFKNIEFLEKWPHYVEHTRVFFGRAADLACGSLYIGTHPKLHAGQKLWQLAKFYRETLPPKHWKEFFTDLREQRTALGLNKSVGAAFLPRPAQGETTLDFFVDGQLHRSFPDLAAKLRAAADHLYRNDDTPLPVKLHHALRSAGIARYLALLGIPVLLMPVQWVCEMIKLLITRPSPEKFLASFYQKYRALTRHRTNFDEVKTQQPIEDKLALIRYSSEARTHIKVLRPALFQDRTKIAESPLWHVCPAKVYECRTDDLGQSQLIVNFENCIKCESCLRGAPADVDWVRDGGQRLIFSSPTEANRKLLALQKNNVGAAFLPRPAPTSRQECRSYAEFSDTVYAEPRYIDAGRAKWLVELLERGNAPARVLAHARNHKFFWAAADVGRLCESASVPSPTHRVGLQKTLNQLFTKQDVKDLEHSHRLTDEQLTFLQSLKPDSETLHELARKDVALSTLVSGLFPAQIAARPELAAAPWIGLTAARTHWQDFPAMQPASLETAAEAMRAIVLGAGEMLLERCKAHATSRVQFPGLFKDEDGHDGIIKFGAVKQLLSEMETDCYRLRVADVDAATLKVFASEAFLRLTYNAGQIIGGSAYSEDDIFSKYYRDSACFRSLLFENRNLPPPREITLPVGTTELEAELAKLTFDPPRSSEALRHLGTQVLAAGFIERPLQQPPSFNYREALQCEQHYDYCDFLVKPTGNDWRYVPEMLEADTELRAYHARLFAYFQDNFWNKQFDGLRYYRLVEKLHMIPLEHVRDMVAQGFMRMYIPQEFGGEGLLKAHYYILCPLSMRYADPSYALTIMAHSSIGTTPILLALNQDLPRAKADLQEFLADQSKIQNLKSNITGILRMLDSPAALKVKPAFTALGETVKADLGKKPMLRSIASEFLRHFMDAGRAGLRMDLPQFKSELQTALAALDTLEKRAEGVIAELDRRAEAAKFFLRLISAGRISAFALTEPSAGSDSGGIQTRAELKRVEVLTDANGKYFMLGDQRRQIVDISLCDISSLPACDVAQIRRQDGREFYEYYELNGAKMWITNGHVAGVFCLYARTPEGPTGFMVRRDSEGLVVGKDEEKMGQRGSPTNELSLNTVRVPRENIIGIEGRGQVNALETLNVGRTGLCVSATAMTAKVLEQTRQFARQHGLDRETWVQEVIGTMAAELYAIESLAYELIGRCDHHGTKSVRTESAIGKYYASEALHRAITAAERVFGIEGYTQLHELEKHRRDARVLNIYEGTNEVQRFLILRDLVDAVLPKATGDNELLRDLKAAVDTFGGQVWQNTNFQPTMFKLAEMAGYLKLIDSAQWRTEWLKKNTGAADATHRQLAEESCARYVEFARAEIERLHTEFTCDFELLKQGLYPPSVRIAMLAAQHQPVVAHREEGRTVVVANITPLISPIPRVSDGELLETCFDLDAASRKLIAATTHACVIAVGPRLAAERLMNLPVDQAVLLQTENWVTDPQTVARLVAQYIGTRGLAADRIMCADSIVATILTGALGAEKLTGTAGAGFEIVDTSTMTVLPKQSPTYVVPEVKADELQTVAKPESAAALFRSLAGIDATSATDELLPTNTLPGRDAAVFLCRPNQPAGLATLVALAEMLHVPEVYAVSGMPADIWKESPPAVLAAGTWANELLARWIVPFPRVQTIFNATGIIAGKLAVPVFGGKVQRLVEVQSKPLVVTFAALGGTCHRQVPWVNLPVPPEPEVTPTLAEAEFIIDVGYALRDREHFDLIVLPLKKRLEELGVKNVMIGGTRKVVEELKLLAPSQQIGQTGTAVNPRVILSLGISGAPQHVDYIGARATIIAFNKDPHAPLMTRPKVVPVVGDLFETVPQFMAAISSRLPATART